MKKNKSKKMNYRLRNLSRSFGILAAITVILVLQAAAQTPTLGNYPNTTVALGANTIVIPNAAPTNTTRINASANTNFKGVLAANPTTGAVRVTNAHTAGTFTVTIKAFSAGGMTAAQTFTLTVGSGTICSGAPQFTNAPDVSTSPSSGSIAIGDFNNDGKQDLAISNQNNTVSIRLGDGAGGFSGAADVSVGAVPLSVAIGDFNNDGNQDFATANRDAGTVSIRLGDGTGGFSGVADVSVGGAPQQLAIGDFNNDGNQDFAVTRYSFSTTIIRLGDGSGGFTNAPDVAAGAEPFGIAIGDFNNDGKQDLAIGNTFQSNTVSIRLGDGAGNFSSAPDSTGAANDRPFSIAIGDFNSDGKQDLAVVNFNAGTVSVRMGNGLGGFSNAADVGIGSNVASVAIGDFNNDGKQDLAATGTTAPNVFVAAIRLGDGAGGFSGTTNIPVNNNGAIAIGDFNSNGKQDFAVAAGNAGNTSIRLGGCTVTAASVSVGGQVTTAAGYGISGALVALTDASGNQRFTKTSSFGYYRFQGVLVGETYIIAATHKRYVFAPQVISIKDDFYNLNFTAETDLKMSLP